MRLALAGVNHSTAPVELREKLAFRLEEIPDALRAVQAKGAREALILSTCNRVEIVAALEEDVATDLLVEGIVGDRGGVTADQ
ncbi:MAG: glutamyl-tRNA reductase, partial [Bryobacteraceae bacterium]